MRSSSRSRSSRSFRHRFVRIDAFRLRDARLRPVRGRVDSGVGAGRRAEALPGRDRGREVRGPRRACRRGDPRRSPSRTSWHTKIGRECQLDAGGCGVDGAGPAPAARVSSARAGFSFTPVDARGIVADRLAITGPWNWCGVGSPVEHDPPSMADASRLRRTQAGSSGLSGANERIWRPYGRLSGRAGHEVVRRDRRWRPSANESTGSPPRIRAPAAAAARAGPPPC